MVPYINRVQNLIAGTLALNRLTQFKVVTQVLFSLLNIVVNPQEHVLDQDRKALAFLVPADLFDAYHVPLRFHPCFLLRSSKRRKKDLKTNLDPFRGTRSGTNKCSFLTDIAGFAFTAFYDSPVRPPKHRCCNQGEPNEFSGVLCIHPSPQARY